MSRLLPLPPPPAHNKRFIVVVSSLPSLLPKRCVLCGVCVWVSATACMHDDEAASKASGWRSGFDLLLPGLQTRHKKV